MSSEGTRSGERLIGIEEVIARTGLKKTTIYKRMKQGCFPRQAKDGSRSLWSEREVEDWIRTRLNDRTWPMPPAFAPLNELALEYQRTYLHH